MLDKLCAKTCEQGMGEKRSESERLRVRPHQRGAAELGVQHCTHVPRPEWNAQMTVNDTEQVTRRTTDLVVRPNPCGSAEPPQVLLSVHKSV